MANEIKIRVNEQSWSVKAAPDTPLLYVLTNELQLVTGVAISNANPTQPVTITAMFTSVPTLHACIGWPKNVLALDISASHFFNWSGVKNFTMCSRI